MSDRHSRKLDQAARAAWLYYIAGNTQDEVATKLNVSRQAAQRLVSLAVAEKLIKFRLNHPIAEAVALEERLRERYGLAQCTVMPVDPGHSNPISGIAIAAAEQIETYLEPREPTVLGLSTGRTLRAAVAEVMTMNRPEHKTVSLVGAMLRDGRAAPYEVVMSLAERTGASGFPLPTPSVTEAVEEAQVLRAQRSYTRILELVAQTSACFVGVGSIAWNSAFHHDGFVNDAELMELIDLGGVGEIAGRVYNNVGEPLHGAVNDRMVGVPLAVLKECNTIIVGGGDQKVMAIRAALRGKLAKGLITDERTAAAVLSLG